MASKTVIRPITLDFIANKLRKEEKKTFLSPYPGAFEQRSVLGCGAFASLVSKHPNSRGRPGGGGGGGMGAAGID